MAVPFTSKDGQPMVAIPTRLPMSWTESPPAFSAVTETIVDLVNELLEFTRLPDSTGSFNFRQEALGASKQRIKITEPVWDQLQDFKWIATSLR